jgi:hypothetical protein
MKVRRPASELLIFLAFVALTVLMTWPWVLHLRDAAADKGDSYLSTWILWWDYHQTFSDPLNLFHANILYPYRYTLAFSEHSYGIALFFFPLYALGVRPLTVHGIATLFGFAFCGYGAFRLARTLTMSNAAAWVAGVAFAFVPYRFHNLPHITYLFAGWIPLLLEALVLYLRSATRRRAGWLGLVFFMNALTCIHWLVLTSIPLGLTVLFLAWRRGLWRRRDLWIRGLVAVGVATVALLPFLVPYLRVSRLYGLVRSADEARFFSAHLIHWMTVDWRNKLWNGVGTTISPYQTELALFPGFLPVVLAGVGFLVRSARGDGVSPAPHTSVYRKWLVDGLSLLTLAGIVLAMLAFGFGSLSPRIFGVELIRIQSAWAPLVLTLMALGARCLLAPPDLRPIFKRLKTPLTDDGNVRSEAIGVALIWAVTGFIGSFGMNFFFHRMLFNFLPLFRSIRVPARWAMICYVGLGLLAALGALRLVERLTDRRRAWKAVACVLMVALFLFEQRAAPLDLVKGDVDPDALTLRLKMTEMHGGIVELPAGGETANYLYTLRAADHWRPLVNGVSGFRPPIVRGVEELSQSRPIPDRFLDLLEAIPVSYLVVHEAALDEQGSAALQDFLRRGVAANRLRLVQQSGDETTRDELFVVTRTEPEVTTNQLPTK